MIIQWYGQSFFRIDSKDAVIAIDPFSKNPDCGFNRVPRFRADIVLISHDHPDHNNAGAVDGAPVFLLGAGECEVKGVFIRGIPSFHDETEGKERGPNTIFVIETDEDLRVCHTGDLGTKKLPEDVIESAGAVDILLIPVGGTSTIDARGAWSVVRQIEPKIVIPMHYRIPGVNLPLDGIEKFLKEAGANPDVEDRLSVRKKELKEASGLEVRLLRPLAVTSTENT